ncbi:hypothetical protein [Sulfobacillus thermosulfidooxidans]|uniref:Uncharacterized protein n=1 Tax=Sulfobacillus thermosulfidooxidans TaxID=28034 RepID=A0A1R0IQ40_SULTH|nr:hypothetical protein [Sulfobacillus thermosulfidooxidans]OLZ09840.1 hypothetical protein BFX05_12970 [Sulfobacillus thermosulfidooxidans]OLZ15854.1 hypothetical protein BFX06_02070 [Sulfobacillus thermosulfidooxidans]OLZ18299.1 hypothetical protein BFX07_08055 [Sulfobacillus thermosulfidooxidans]PSR24266.1 MAG: hypothetical protein C7B47_15175 [Sulfobacillus thermosulfidooxidans]
MKTVISDAKPQRIRNEAVFLYDMNADDIFQENGYVVIDSSLGLVTPRVNNREAEKDNPPSPPLQSLH